MSERKRSTDARKTTKTILFTQSAITLLAAGTSWLIVDPKAAYSAGIGGGISIVATAYFAKQVFSVQIGESAAKVARNFYFGEAIKLLLTAVLFVIALVWLNILFLPLFLTYVATLLAYWLVLPFSLDTSVRKR